MSMIAAPPPRRRRIGRLFGLAALAAACCSGASAAKEVTVTIDHHAFMPARLEIAAGTTVTWKNADDTPHTVRARNQAFASAALDTGDSFSHTFATPGDYAYSCSLHPFMVGEIVVTPAGGR
jgi:plastocyanin